MPIPTNAKAFAQALDPSDVVDFYGAISRGNAADVPAPLLIGMEQIASFTLAPTVEAVAAGLKVMSTADNYPAPALVGDVLVFWLGLPSASPASPLFVGAGTQFGIEFTATTNNSPPRIKQRTMVVTVQNQ